MSAAPAGTGAGVALGAPPAVVPAPRHPRGSIHGPACVRARVWHAAHVVAVGEAPSYYALRVCPRADAPRWWTSAREGADRARWAIQAILAGRTRVEVSAHEALAALAWARSLEGWDPDRLTPLWVYPAAPPQA
jgi:hypothetical protein